MENELNISLDSLEGINSYDSDHHALENEIELNKIACNKKVPKAETLLKTSNVALGSFKCLSSASSSNDCAHERIQSNNSKLKISNKNVQCKLKLDNAKQAKNSSYLEIFRKRIGFSDCILSHKKQGNSCLKNGRGLSSTNLDESPSSTEASNSLSVVSQDLSSFNGSEESPVSSNMGEKCTPLKIISQPDCNDDYSKLSPESKLSREEYKKGVKEMSGEHGFPLETNILTPPPPRKLRSRSAPEDHSCETKNTHSLMKAKSSSIKCQNVNKPVLPQQNKLQNFLMRNAYGNSVSDLNCKFQLSVQKLKGTKTAEENAPEDKSAKEVTDSGQKMRKIYKPPAATKRNKNKKNGCNVSGNIEFLMERHRQESLLAKKINEDVFRNNVCEL